MKKILPFLLIIVSLILLCWGNKKQLPSDFPVKYENDLFSISLPQGWEYVDSGWHGLDSFGNRVEFYSPTDRRVWLHIKKNLFPAKWKNVYEGKELEVGHLRENEKLIKEIDDVEVSGYPACILYYSSPFYDETLISKLFIIYLQDSHIAIRLEEEFFDENWDDAEELGDLIVNTIQLKKVKNPLENDSIFKSLLKIDCVDEDSLNEFKQTKENKDVAADMSALKMLKQ